MPRVIYLCHFTAVPWDPCGQVFKDKQSRTHEAEAITMTILIATCHGSLLSGYTCYQNPSYAFFNTPLTHVMQMGDRLVNQWPKNKSCKASCPCVACHECTLPSQSTLWLTKGQCKTNQTVWIWSNAGRIIHTNISALCLDSKQEQVCHIVNGRGCWKVDLYENTVWSFITF